ncbi:MAG: hypothetical protein ACK5PB_23450 [Pirellula sp.]
MVSISTMKNNSELPGWIYLDTDRKITQRNLCSLWR